MITYSSAFRNTMNLLVSHILTTPWPKNKAILFLETLRFVSLHKEIESCSFTEFDNLPEINLFDSKKTLPQLLKTFLKLCIWKIDQFLKERQIFAGKKYIIIVTIILTIRTEWLAFFGKSMLDWFLHFYFFLFISRENSK